MKLLGNLFGHKVVEILKTNWLIISGFTTFVRKYDTNNLSSLSNLLFEVICQAEEKQMCKML